MNRELDHIDKGVGLILQNSSFKLNTAADVQFCFNDPLLWKISLDAYIRFRMSFGGIISLAANVIVLAEQRFLKEDRIGPVSKIFTAAS